MCALIQLNINLKTFLSVTKKPDLSRQRFKRTDDYWRHIVQTFRVRSFNISRFKLILFSHSVVLFYDQTKYYPRPHSLGMATITYTSLIVFQYGIYVLTRIWWNVESDDINFESVSCNSTNHWWNLNIFLIQKIRNLQNPKSK